MIATQRAIILSSPNGDLEKSAEPWPQFAVPLFFTHPFASINASSALCQLNRHLQQILTADSISMSLQLEKHEDRYEN